MRFINNQDTKDLRTVTSLKLLTKNNTFDSEGIFSPSIFGSEDYSCECGNLQGSWHSGVECNKCGTSIINPKENINRYGRFKIPHGYKVFNVIIYQIIKKHIKNFENMIKPQNKHITRDGDIIYETENNFRLLNFVDFSTKYEESINIILPDEEIKNDEKLLKLKNFLLNNEDIVMTDSIIILPIHLRPAQVSQKEVKIEPLNKTYISINTHIHSIESSADEESVLVIDHELFEIQKCMVDLYDQIIEIIAHKDGLARDQILSNKINFSGRAVISVKNDNDPTSVTIPKIMFTELYMPKVLTYISEKQKITYTDAIEYYYKNRFDFENALINEAIEEILLTKPVVLLNRNPSLHLLSIQAFIVSGVTNDYTIKLTKPVLRSFNADFDFLTFITKTKVKVESINTHLYAGTS